MTGRVVARSAEAALEALVDRVRPLREGAPAGRRLVVAIAGAPAGGKSTLAARLVERLGDAVLVPMDGFHLDDALLAPAGLLPTKGAPDTYDVAGLAATLARIVADDGRVVHVPVFDRTRELSRAAAASVAPHHRSVVVEGNYLLLRDPPWRELLASFDLTVMIETGESTLRERLVRRWREHGFDDAAALERAERNDLPNGRTVRSRSVAPDLRLAEAS